jgi:hypothetical protein
MNYARLGFGLLALTSSCGGSVFEGGASASGGAGFAVGGQLNVGGNTGQGGSIQVGGSLNMGGISATGGGVSSGGQVPTGGAVSTGGNVSVGGTVGTGGKVSTGGKAATGGSVGTGGTGPDQRPGAACQTASDCRVHDDCCSCDVYLAAATPIHCDLGCTTNKCASLGIGTDEVACVAGRCVFARSCDLSQVACEVVTPTCPAGQVPSVKGSCYGPCLPVGRCSEVSSCDVCKSVGLACVTIEYEINPVYHCVSTPAACANNPTCGCMNVCGGGAETCYDPSSTDLMCVCNEC